MKLHGGNNSEHSRPAPEKAKPEKKPAPEKTAPAEKKAPAKKERPPKAERPKKEGAAKARVALIVVLAIIAAALVAAAVGVGYVGRIKTIYPNVRIDGIDVGELTVEAAADRLTQHGYSVIGDDAVTVSLPLDVSLTIRADEVCAETPTSDIARAAYAACKSGSAIDDSLTYLRCRFGGGMDVESNSVRTVDAAAVRAAVESAAREVQLALLESDLRIG